MVKIWQ